MEIVNSYARFFCLVLMLVAGCGLEEARQVDNPVADGLRAQAHQLDQETQACRAGAAEYRAQQRIPMECGDGGLVQVGTTDSHTVSECIAATLEAVPACQRWADSYQAMIRANGPGGVQASEQVTLMEVQVLGPGH
ncbi:MAG TPA: hypothetical protein VMU41_09150 [Candidatus Binataceae bacterium]|nr:hypothetical protein [Candidatus Binataceae bacterium]